ncbi:MAG: membrane dipeptidase [Deltaproteobacteria bacterium]|nr:membrane dipeptidase [Deltaproteobacteria bacterium]
MAWEFSGHTSVFYHRNGCHSRESGVREIRADFDGGGVDGCNHVSKPGNITLEPVKHGYKEEQIRKIREENLIYVWTLINGWFGRLQICNEPVDQMVVVFFGDVFLEFFSGHG